MEKELTSKDWKFCAIVDLGIENFDEQQTQFNEHIIRFFKPTDRATQGFFVAEVYSLRSKYPDNETAFHGSLDILTKVLSRISIAIFRQCRVISSVSVTQFKADKKETFSMLLTSSFNVRLGLKTFKIGEHPNIFFDINEQELNDSVSEFSLAINSNSIYLKFSHYYNCIERVAHYLTKENVQYKCKYCGEINEVAVKATANKMREIFSQMGYEKKIFNFCRTIRGKLTHGASERTRKLNLDILKHLSIIEKIALHVIEKHTSINLIQGKIIPQLNDQFVEIIGKKRWNKNRLKNSAYDIVSHQIKFNFQINEVGKNQKKHGFITGHIPLNFDPRNAYIFPYAWPY